MCEVRVAAVADYTLECLLQPRTVVRMHPLKHALKRRSRVLVVSENTKRFLGPVKLSARHVPAETARKTELLRLGQIGLGPPQGLVRAAQLSRALRDQIFQI